VLKERDARLPALLERLDRHLQRITALAYANVNLVSNEVLSRNPTSNGLLHSLWADQPIVRPGLFTTIGWLAQYYVKSLVHFLRYVVTWAVQRIAADRGVRVLDEPVYVIDTFVFQDAVRRERRYDERFFPGLAAVLRARGKRVVILPRFYGSLGHPLRVADVIRVLRQSGETFLTEFRSDPCLGPVAHVAVHPRLSDSGVAAGAGCQPADR